ncbi:universal stress protein [Nocardioides sp. LMS-CY]|uniref:Nucleotide-binding universal stress UspA family protein n=1 Tax=Nocardioides soli TaxID=1036020 RepID=A0A7W4Z1R9_9ACTN|nr:MULTISPECIES: universal stress protein [Nocardioides]MBB3041870.1 nucleotide-binding universal stress UspA family protein [Nocardioides soli]QWF21378.1 universal stress protein [Nocardioides sp. LMS-CY]
MGNTENTLIPPGTVVVGIDGSPSSDRALDWAIDQAVRERRQLTLAHGIDPAGVAWTDPMGGSHRAVVDAMADDGRRLLADARAYVEIRQPDLGVNQTAWMADPRVTLLKLAEKASVLVVGSRGRGPVASLLLGSVGLAVVRHATCPVVVVRPGNPGRVRNGVVVGVDGGPSSRATVEFAYRQASLRQLPLTILHGIEEVWPPNATDDDLRISVTEPLTGLAEKYPDVTTRLELVREDAAGALVEQSRRMDLVVLGAHHGGRLSTLLTGSVALSVVEHAECPVAIVS